MKEYIATMHALGNVTRVRICAALRHGELCQCQLLGMFGRAAANAEYHVDVLVQTGIVKAVRRPPRWTYYRLKAAADIPPLARELLALAMEAVGDERTIRHDEARRTAILQRYPPERCALGAPRPSRGGAPRRRALDGRGGSSRIDGTA